MNPVLIEAMRGRLVESWHRGAVAVAEPGGALIFSTGDVARPVFPRSAIKAIQCLPLIETGAADKFEFGAPEIALACASHSGTERHVALAGAMLARAGLEMTALACGAHEPLGAEPAQALVRAGQVPTVLHNNCSGKHAGMLATAVHLGEPAAHYLHPEHPVQVRIAGVLSELTGVEIGSDNAGIDGCSAPNWALPLAGLARAFARLVTGIGLSAARGNAARQIIAACWSEPELVAGPGRLDSELLARFPGVLFVKTGAEGVYCGGVPGRGLGFALKIDDGAKRASELAVRAVVARLVPEAADLPLTVPLPNWRGLPAASLRCQAAFLDALSGAAPRP